MNCKQIIDFLMDYIDGELPEHVKMCFDMHLSNCPQCVEYLSSYRETVKLAKKCCHGELPVLSCEPMPEQLIQAILAARKQMVERTA